MSILGKLNLAETLMRNGWVSHSINVLNELDVTQLSELEIERRLSIFKLSETASANLSTTDYPISIFGDRILSSLHFRELPDRELKKQAFKQGVDYIDIETSSQCNRKCHYCTNSTLDRISDNKFLDVSVLENILKELAEIDYDKELHFVGYNEPLMHRESIVNVVRIASKILPNAKIVIFTNGDYLDYDYLNELIDAGVDRLNISVHLAPGAAYNSEEIIDRIFKLSTKLRVTPVLKQFVKKREIYFSLLGSAIELEIFQRDYSNVGHDRGGLLDVQIKKTRTAACTSPLKQFIVGYTGTILPCCALVGDDPRHNTCIVGDAFKESIFDIYAGKKYIEWRKGLASLKPKEGACKYCNAECDTPDNTDPNRYQIIDFALSKMGA